MNNNLLQALIGAGIRPSAASRLARAIQDAASQGTAAVPAQNSLFTRGAGVGYQPVSGDQATFALFASAPGTHLSLGGDPALFGPGGGALGVNGVSVFDGDIYCSSGGAFASLTVSESVAVAGGVTATQISATTALTCGEALQVDQESVEITVPVTATDDLTVNGAAIFNNDVTLNQQVNIVGNVVWANRLRVPAQVQVLSSILGNNDTLTVTPAQVDVMNLRGGQAKNFKYELVPVTKAITDLVEFDPELCAIVAKPNAPEVLVGGTIKITVA